MDIGSNTLILTFDDGPHPEWTPRILDLLQKFRHKAIFFVLGKHISGNENIILRILEEDHILGSHGMNHIPLIFNRENLFEKEIVSLHNLIKSEFDYEIRYFRPPWGIINSKLGKRCEDILGYKLLLWDKDSLDYIWPFRRRINLNKNREQQIILFHDGHAFSPMKYKQHTLRLVESLLEKKPPDFR